MNQGHESEDEGDITTVASRAELNAALREKTAEPEVPRPYLVVISGDSAGRMIRVAPRTVIGRHTSADVVIDLDGVSRKHAAIHMRADGSAELVDLGSRNGTFVNGEPITMCVLRDGDRIQIGPVTILKFSYRDALEEKLQQNLYDSATRDALTRAYNKRYFAEALPREVAFALRHKRGSALMLFDVDHFKRVNDRHGHPAGDHVLQTLAATVAEVLRAEDVLARYGGEEFAIILRDLDEAGAVACAERIRKTVETTTFVFGDVVIPVTISIGVASISSEVATATALVSAADARLYRAKNAGRNRVEPAPR